MFRTEPVTSTVSQTSLLKNKIHLECTPNIVSSREEKKKKKSSQISFVYAEDKLWGNWIAVLLCFGSNMRTGFPFSAVLSVVEELEERVKGMMQPSALSVFAGRNCHYISLL